MYENAAIVKGGIVLVDISSFQDSYHQVYWAQDRFVGRMYSPSQWHEHIPGGVALNERILS
jgi:hypothetical protein